MESLSFWMTREPGWALLRSTGRLMFCWRISWMSRRGPRTLTSMSFLYWLAITRSAGRLCSSMGMVTAISTWSSPTTKYQRLAPMTSDSSLSSQCRVRREKSGFAGMVGTQVLEQGLPVRGLPPLDADSGERLSQSLLVVIGGDGALAHH